MRVNRYGKRVGLLMLPVLLSALLISPIVSYTADDTYIHLQFARNILDGKGFSFNPGEPTYGSTSPLWVFLIAAGGMLSHDLLAVSKILSICFTFGALLLFALIVNMFLREYIYVFACTLVWSLDIWLIRWAPSGMETSLALFVMLSGLYLYAQERGSLKRMYLSPAVFALLTLIRPEGFLLYVICIVDSTVMVKKKAKHLVFFLLPYVVVLAPWVLFAYLQFGQIVPNTFIAKGSSPYSAFHLWNNSIGSVIKSITSSRLWELVFLLIWGAVSLKMYGIRGWWSRAKTNRFLVMAIWMTVLPAAYILGGLPIVSRYLLLVIPALILLGFYSLKKVLRYFQCSGTVQRWVLSIFVLVICAQNMVVGWTVVYPHVHQFTKGMRECFIPIGEWFAERTPPETTIAALDIGALGYMSRRRVLDLGGLITPEILPLLERYDPEDLADCYPGLQLPIPRAEYIVYRSKDPDGVTSLKELYEPLFTRRVASLGITADPGDTYYTVCRIRWDRVNYE